jgi:peroxiredoxin
VYPRLQELGYKLIGVSPDSPEQNAELAQDLGLEFPLMSDNGLAWTRRFGIVFEAERRGRLPVPAVYLVDGEGTVQFHYVHPNYRVRLDPDLLVVAAEVGVKTPTK